MSPTAKDTSDSHHAQSTADVENVPQKRAMGWAWWKWTEPLRGTRLLVSAEAGNSEARFECRAVEEQMPHSVVSSL